MDKSHKFDVYGRHVLAEKSANGWKIYYISDNGKRRPADDIMVPVFVTADDIRSYLADLCHEWATSEHPDVSRLDSV